MPHALEGLHVVEFAAYAAGPVIGKFLGNHGATVVHVESRARPDGFRLQYPPYRESRPGIDRAGLFALCNDSKLGITVDLKHPQAQPVKQALATWADVIIENFTPGTIERLGLGYGKVQALNPGAIMLSTANLGQLGPHARHPGFGSQLSSFAGFTHLTGYPDQPPTILYGPYIDFIAVGMGLVAILAALDRRAETGHGQYIDLSQFAAGIQFMAAPLLDLQVNGRVAERRGNWHPAASPHGVFPCAGEDRWCTIAVYSDAQWQSLCDAMGRPAFVAGHPEWDSLLGRRAAEAEIAAGIAEWTGSRGAEEIAAQLQAAGVAAAVVRRVDELYADPQLEARGFWQALEHPVLGSFHYQGPPWQISAAPWEIRGRSPLFGEHNALLFGEMLGMDGALVQSLVDSGVIEEVAAADIG